MTTNKYLNQEINLQIFKTGYGHWRLIVDTLEDKYTALTTDSLLIDAINSEEDELTRFGTHQDCIDNAVKYVLTCNEIIF